MRNLTITREKSFVASLAKMKVYIEDSNANDLTINNTPCRKLGTLKNGETKTFCISEEKAKVYVIADKLSRGFCNEYYNIPEGAEDVSLRGKNKYNLANGNAFRFHGVTDEDVLKNRKKGNRIGILILIVAFIVGVIIGLIGTNHKSPKEFSGNGLVITLTDDFRKTSVGGYTVCYGSNDAVVFALEEEVDENVSVEEYGQMVLENNEFDESIQLQNIEGITCFEYEATNEETNDTYVYLAAVYKDVDSYWLIQFAVLKEDYNAYKDTILTWAKSVKFE